VPAVDNAYAATGHGMLGVTLAPSTAAALREFIESGQRPGVLAPFRFDRG
jgi:glycine/D-amino acid oxidase-like deaminating enzyme